MLGKDIAGALGGIPDEKIMDAMNVYKRKQRSRNILFRAAAVAATLAIILTAALWPRKTEDEKTITSPGFLKVYAYDLSSGVAISEQEGVDLADSLVESPSAWWIGMNMYYGLPLTLNVSDERFEGMVVTFDVIAEHGNFYGDIYSEKYKKNAEDKVASMNDAELGDTFTIENGESIFWEDRKIRQEASAQGLLTEEYLAELGDLIYVDVIVKADDQIAGYAVIVINHHSGLTYTAAVREVVFYMMEDGTIQEVTEEYVRQEIARLK